MVQYPPTPTHPQTQRVLTVIIIKETIIEAGKIASNWYKNNPKSWKKEDGTSVSEADIEINEFLYKNLSKKIKNTANSGILKNPISDYHAPW